MGRILTRLTRAATVSPADAGLLDAFLSGRDDQAFRALVERHGSMVFAVCMRVLRHRQDAEDAFQATFLVLARRAADVWPRSGVGSWLYGVAYRVALKSRSARARRLGREQPLGDADPPTASGEPAPSDLAEAVDRAVGKLPEVYRAAVVACDLEGQSRREAAEQLGWKEGTLSGRLARARQILADRLRRAGLTLPAGGVAAALGREAAPAVGSDVIEKTVWVATGTLAAGVPAPVAALTEGVVQSMFLVKLKAAAVAVLASCTIGFGVWASAGAGDDPGTGPGDNPNGTGGTAPPGKKAADKPVAKVSPNEGKFDWPADMPVELLILQGRWALIRETRDPPPERAVGSAVPADAPRVVITGNRMTWARETAGATESHTLTIGVGRSKLFAGGPGIAEIDLIRQDGTRSLGLMGMPAPTKGGAFLVILCFSSDRGLERGGERPKDFKATAGQSLYTLLPLPVGDNDPNAGADLRNKLQVSRDLLDAQWQLDQAKEAIITAHRQLIAAQAVEPAMRARRDELALYLRKTAEAAEARANKLGPDAVKAPTPSILDEARAKAEVERQRDRADAAAAEAQRNRAALEAATKRAELAEARLAELTRQLQAERDEARAQADRAVAAERAAREVLEKVAGVKLDPLVQTVAVADENGKLLPIPEALQSKIEEQAIDVVRRARGELTAAGKGTPFATVDVWKRAEKAGHVKIRFPKQRSWVWGPDEASRVDATEMLIPMTDRRAPEYILVRNSDTYRAFYDLPEGAVIELQKLLAELKK
jgi:RNA polymerase sigma factor (sigma-70 family)